MFNRITAAVLFVDDFETCFRFYSEALGLEVAVKEPNFAAFRLADQDFAIQGVDQSAEIVHLEPGAFQPRGDKVNRTMLCARVDDVDAAHATLKSRGVPFTCDPVNQPWGLRAAYFTDPAGNIWELAKPVK